MSNILMLPHLQLFHLTKEDIANKKAAYSIIFLVVNNFDNTSMQDATNIEEIIFWSLLFGLVNIGADTYTLRPVGTFSLLAHTLHKIRHHRA
jgi:hypothetical protein